MEQDGLKEAEPRTGDENKSEDEDRMPFTNLDQPCAASSLFVAIFSLMKVDEG